MREGLRRYQKLFVGFFILMLLLSGVSRAMDTVTVPKVSIEEVKSGSLMYTAFGTGRITAAEQEYVRSEEGAFLKQVLVGEGQAVLKGEPLFVLDLKSVEEQLLEEERELAASKLNLKKAELDGRGSTADLAAVESARTALERAEFQNEVNLLMNDGKQMLADKRAIEDGQALLRNAQKQLEENQAKSGADLGLFRLELQQKESAVEKLRKITGDKGIIRADISGTVADLTAEVGTELGTESLCSLIPQGAAYLFEAEISEEDSRHMTIGDEISITPQGENIPMKELFIQSLQNSGEKTKLAVRLPAGTDVFQGMTASFTHRSATSIYPYTVSLEALRGSENDYFVLLTEETNTVLGRQWKAKRAKVEVLAKDSARAALADSPGEGVIGRSSKPLTDGDRVREVYDE